MGRMTFPDGSRYTGEWVDDRVHGQGEHVYANGNRYKGEWVDGSITGVGVLTFADGERYEGELKDGRMQGHGTYVYVNGDRYEGEWKDDRRHGKGIVVYVSPEGEIVEQYDGQWFGGLCPLPVPLLHFLAPSCCGCFLCLSFALRSLVVALHCVRAHFAPKPNEC